ncbi:MAG: glycosyltransferase family 2 protein [Lachnospiraceae bacterium]|nr:glycosyltransferase family 2 protein [Lachnospiraceae bacterium]
MDHIAVLIPCYNEEKTIGKVVADTKRALPDAAIYVYNNNSTDRTAEIAREAGAIVRNEYKQGKGNVIRRMFREIDAECYVMVDGDDTYPMDAAPELVDRVLNRNADMVVGDRLSSTYFTENKRPFHNFGNSLVRGCINRLFDCNVRDIMTGYRAFSYDFVKTFPVLSKGFEIETEMTIHAVYNNMQIDNVVIEYRDRPEGSSSKLNTFSDGFRVLKTIVSLYRNYRPMGFFGFLAAILAVLAVIFFIPVLRGYFATGLVRKFPTLIVCGFVMMAALLSFFSGMILSNMDRNARRCFEVQRNLLHSEYEKLRSSRNRQEDTEGREDHGGSR